MIWLLRRGPRRRRWRRTCVASLRSGIWRVAVRAMGRRRFLLGLRDLTAAAVAIRLPAMRMRPAAAGDNAVLRWNLAALQAIQAGHLGPPMVARALAALHTCIYDAWATFDPVAVPVYAPATLRQPEALRTPENVLQA